MKNSLYVIAGLLIVIWAIILLGFKASGIVHGLLVLAGFFILVRLIFGKQLSANYKDLIHVLCFGKQKMNLVTFL